MITQKKVLSSLFFLLLLVSTFFAVPPKQAEAISVPVFDGVAIAELTIIAQSAVTMQTKELALDGVVFALINAIIDQIGQQMVSWINSGFDGNPGFVTDPAGLFASAANNVAADFIDELGLGFLCDSFSLEIQFALSANFGFGNRGLTSAGACTLNDIYENVASGEIASMSAFYDVALKPNNNPYISYLDAESALVVNVSQNNKILGDVVSWGNGFLSDFNIDGYIETPGAFVETQLNDAIGSGQQRLQIADEISEIIGALMNMLLDSAFNGLASVGSSGSYTFTAPDFINNTEGSITETCPSGETDSTGRCIGDYDTPVIDNPGGGGSAGVAPGRREPFNVAFDKTARQITTLQTGGVSWLAGRAIDNNIDTGNIPYTRLNTDRPTIAITSSVENPWWELDLEELHFVEEVKIYLRSDIWLTDAVSRGGVRVDFFDTNRSLVHQHSFRSTQIANSVPLRVTSLPDGQAVRFIRINRIPPEGQPNSTTGQLHLAEVQVSGLPQIDYTVSNVNLALKNANGQAYYSAPYPYVHPTTGEVIEYPASNIVDGSSNNTAPETDEKTREPWPAYAGPAGTANQPFFSVRMNEMSNIAEVRIHPPTGTIFNPETDSDLYIVLARDQDSAINTSLTLSSMRNDSANYRVVQIPDLVLQGGAPYIVQFDLEDYFETGHVRLQREGQTPIGLGELEVIGKLAPRF
ncbi:MAG: hypothetical protein WDZ88_01980 [Candidatus Paceibacterota bacterium]